MFKSKFLDDAFYIAAGIAVAIVVYYALGFILQTSDPIVTVVSGSMEPTLYRGDMVVLRGEKTENLQKGIIIVYFHPDQKRLIIHRVFEVNADGTFTTKGDNAITNRNPDPWKVQREWIKGKMIFRIPYLGYPRILLDEILKFIIR